MTAVRPAFGTLQLFTVLADRLNDDPVWFKKAGDLNYRMLMVFTDPPEKVFSFSFEDGRLCGLAELPGREPADFVLFAPSEVWKQIIVTHTLSPQAGFLSKKVGVEGKLSTLIKHLGPFTYLLDTLKALDPVVPVEAVE